jgi:hypothetical protein
MLEPTFRVVAQPDTSYYSEFLYWYRVFQEDSVIQEFRGDFRKLAPGELITQAREFVNSVATQLKKTGPRTHQTLSPAAPPEQPVIASRLIPPRMDVTYFNSGRAAFTYLLGEVVCPRRVWLPTFVCWSLVSAMQHRFPQTRLLFYSVDRDLKCHWPKETEPGDALVFIHYFGHLSERPDVAEHCTLLEDISHLLIPPSTITGQFAFGSLRKIFRIADGGVLLGRHDPVYEPDDGMAVWLRLNSRDWRDLREAENMMDRSWKMSDMSSQSVAAMLAYDVPAAAVQRQVNQQFLADHFPAGQPLIQFCPDEVPLLHNRILPDTRSRDSLRAFLAARGIFCSIHWPLHPLLKQASCNVDATAAEWLEQHVLSIPVADDFDESRMATVCDTANEWVQAGG